MTKQEIHTLKARLQQAHHHGWGVAKAEELASELARQGASMPHPIEALSPMHLLSMIEQVESGGQKAAPAPKAPDPKKKDPEHKKDEKAEAKLEAPKAPVVKPKVEPKVEPVKLDPQDTSELSEMLEVLGGQEVKSS